MKYLEKVVVRVIRRVYDYMEETGRTDSFERFPYLETLVRRFTARRPVLSGHMGYGAEREEIQGHSSGAPENGIRQERYETLLEKLSPGKGDAVLETAAGLALAATLETEFAAYLNYYTGNRATLQLACEMCGEFCPDYADVKKRWKILRRVFQVENKTPLNYANIEAGHELLSYLSGEGVSAGSAAVEEGTERFFYGTALHPMYVRESLVDEGAGLLARGDTVLHICGRGGRRFLVKHIAKRMKQDALFVYADQICGEEENKGYRLRQILREAFLNSCIVCIQDDGQTSPDRKKEKSETGLFHAIRVLSEEGIKVILCTEKALGAEWQDMPKAVRMELTPLSRAQRACVWRGFAQEYHLQEDVERCSVLYKMNASEIARAVAERARSCVNEEPVSDICYRILCCGETQKLGTVIRPCAGLDDLFVSGQIKKTLGEICCGAVQGYRIYEEWGLDRQFPYGKTVSVLLAGAPGTGKTMTAHVLAHEIGAPLYQVDLSHILDKYIGETEKHLEQVFEFAAKTSMVLFFDEADALFAKRGEVREGKDRYANMEVSYLLQRMEQFDGVVILATNFYQHIDRAFLRRIKYVLKYQEPDKAMRKRMWESFLVPSLPKEMIDTDYLAKQFSLSGGVIKNVIQGACIAAAYENRPLHMVHILRAIGMEYEKLDLSITKELWGEYGYLMEQTETPEESGICQ